MIELAQSVFAHLRYNKIMVTVYTIGHSTRQIDEFIDLLTTHGIEQLVDIRTIPRSRHNPQYGEVELRSSLKESEIVYVYLKSLGGLRPAVDNSVNDAWRNKSFRNYADYMQSQEFEEGLVELLSLSQKATTVIMCAEAVPWRCHRSLVSDALLVSGVKVYDILSKTSVKAHTLTSFAVVDGNSITYPAN